MLSYQTIGFSMQHNPILENKDCNQANLALADTNDLYSLSTLDLVTIDCFFDDKKSNCYLDKYSRQQ